MWPWRQCYPAAAWAWAPETESSEKYQFSDPYPARSMGCSPSLLQPQQNIRLQLPDDDVILFPVEAHSYNGYIVFFSWFVPRVSVRNDHMNTFSSSSLKATIKDIFFYYSNAGLDSCYSLFPGTFSSYLLVYILLLENEYYMTHGISLLAFVTCTGTQCNVRW